MIGTNQSVAFHAVNELLEGSIADASSELEQRVRTNQSVAFHAANEPLQGSIADASSETATPDGQWTAEPKAGGRLPLTLPFAWSRSSRRRAILRVFACRGR